MCLVVVVNGLVVNGGVNIAVNAAVVNFVVNAVAINDLDS